MKYLDSINIVLIIGILVQLYQPTSDLIPLLQEHHAPRHMHSPNAAEQSLHQEIVTLGTYVNVEDLVRYLQENPKLYQNNPDVLPLIRELQVSQQELLKTEELILQTEAKLNQIAINMYKQLSPEQKKQLNNERNLDSVQQIEAAYWNDLIQELESK